MASIDELKGLIDLHDLANRLGLERPNGRGNYRSPKHTDKNPSLSIFANGKAWKDHSTDESGSCIDLVKYVFGCDTGESVRRLHDLYGIPFATFEEPRHKSRAEYVAECCLIDPSKALNYLMGRGISEEVVQLAIKNKSVGWNSWTSSKVDQGEPMHGGPAAAFIIRSLSPGHVVAVDMRYVNPQLNGGIKTSCVGEKTGHPWVSSWESIRKAHTVYIVESPMSYNLKLCFEID